jgi:uncharacterized protein YodC (DUF2158 family)
MADIITPFKVGDVVQLKSGGPAMTVSRVYESGIVTAQWFDIGKVRHADFDIATLQVREERFEGSTHR